MVIKGSRNSNAQKYQLLYGFFVESLVRLSKIFVVECLYDHPNYDLIVVEKTFPTILNHMPKVYITILDDDFRMCIVV